MTERESIQRALEHLRASDDTLKEVMSMIDKEQSVKSMKRAGRMTLRTALIAALIAVLGIITALAASEGGFLQVVRNNFNVRDRAPDAEIVQMQDVETGEIRYFANSEVMGIIADDEDGNATSYTIAFTAGEHAPKELRDWKLGKLPEGFEQTEASRDDRRGVVGYKAHPEGIRVELIDFSYELPGSGITFYQPFTLENVTVNGDDGVLIKSPIFTEEWQGQRYELQQLHLFWFSSDAGVGFTLYYYGIPGIDLIELAESVEPV